MSDIALLVDGLIIVGYFAMIIGIGLWVGRREESLEDYALGGRKIPWWAVMASIIAAETSAATFLGAPVEGFSTQALVYVQLTMGLILGRILVGYVFLKPYYLYRVYTVYDFLLHRFGKGTKYVVSFFFLIMRVLASGVRLYVPSLVMVLAWKLFVQRQDVTYQALDTWVPYAWMIIALTILTGIYTVLGGIKAVIWTDVIQAALMFTGAIVAIITLLYHIGGDSMNLLNGFAALADAVPNMTNFHGYFRTGFEDFTADTWNLGLWEIIKVILVNPYTLPAALIAATLGNMAAFGTDQDMVQRMLTAETYKKARRSLITAALMDVPIAAAFTFIGILLYVFYQQNPDLMPGKSNDVFGQYILNVMPVVVRGFVLAGVFATAMGSLSAALNALATAATNDWYIPLIAPKASEHHHVLAARFFTVLFAILMILIAVIFAIANVIDPTIRIIPVALGIAGFILGPMLGIFLVGMFTKHRGCDAGNIVAFLTGIVGIVLISGRHLDLANWLFPPQAGHIWALPEWLRSPDLTDDPRVSAVPFTWYALVGAVITFSIAILFPTPKSVVEAARIRREEGRAHETKRTGEVH